MKSDEQLPETFNDGKLKEVQPKEVTSLVRAPRNAQPAAGSSLREVQENFETLGTNLREFVKKRHSSMKLLSEDSAEQPMMWKMVSEIGLLYAESFQVLV